MITVDHDIIRDWIEARDGRPVRGEDGSLHVDFAAPEALHVEEVPWDEFFHLFEDKNFAFSCRDDEAREDRACSFVDRDAVGEEDQVDEDPDLDFHDEDE